VVLFFRCLKLLFQSVPKNEFIFRLISFINKGNEMYGFKIAVLTNSQDRTKLNHQH